MILKNAYIWHNGIFVRRDLYIKNGNFVAKLENPEREINLEGKYVFPGFSDSHAHVLGVGIKSLTLNLEDNDIEQVLHSNREIVIGRGWSELPSDVSKLNDLKKPVILIRRCGHVAWINKYAMSFLKCNDHFIYEEELEKIWKLLPEEFYVKAFERGQEEFLKKGITSVHSDDLHGVSFETLLRLLRESKLRIYEKLYTSEPWKYEYGTIGISKIFGIKVFADGSLGGKTAYLSKPYVNSANYGKFTLPENFKEIVKFANNNGLQVCVHTIGDEALTRVLELLGKNYGHRIIHAQIIKKSDFSKLQNFVFSIQPHFFIEDQKIINYIPKGNFLLYPFKQMFNNGIKIAFSSDAPVSPHDPRYVIEGALKIGFTLEESIKLYTEASGMIINENIGKLHPGFKADFVVYSDKSLTNIEAVYVNGEKVY
ncbi:amidohydrolase [Thermosipho atlanticus]|uniref:Amidohydrolase 3 domain-containing protein n=1 Tax=Thermosipho atlanticus DSM 15807 TaxID=1123380 RepID=A0A1M5R7P8_9BACT|nr:amidohydrolase family protein [Thermosipho atlanticus]SHH22374.1 hypothetical protein SAMN02745199_0387 [Thermosipho atlanticus DSM 15807]